MDKIHQNVSAKDNTKMRLRVYREATKSWEDGPEVHSVESGFNRLQLLKISFLLKLSNLLSSVKARLENPR